MSDPQLLTFDFKKQKEQQQKQPKQQELLQLLLQVVVVVVLAVVIVVLFKALRAVRRAIVESCCSVDDLSWKLFGRILYNFEAFCEQGASFGMLFGSILNPWDHFWSNFEPLGSFLEHLVHIFWC